MARHGEIELVTFGVAFRAAGGTDELLRRLSKNPVLMSHVIEMMHRGEGPLLHPVEELNIGHMIPLRLKDAGIVSVEQVTLQPQLRLSYIRGMGPKTLSSLSLELRRYRLSLREDGDSIVLKIRQAYRNVSDVPLRDLFAEVAGIDHYRINTLLESLHAHFLRHLKEMSQYQFEARCSSFISKGQIVDFIDLVQQLVPHPFSSDGTHG